MTTFMKGCLSLLMLRIRFNKEKQKHHLNNQIDINKWIKATNICWQISKILFNPLLADKLILSCFLIKQTDSIMNHQGGHKPCLQYHKFITFQRNLWKFGKQHVRYSHWLRELHSKESTYWWSIKAWIGLLKLGRGINWSQSLIKRQGIG